MLKLGWRSVVPEGAEVKRCSEVLEECILGKTIVKLTPTSGKLLRKGIPGAENLQLPRTVRSVNTKGKLIYVELSEKIFIASTLGMSGWWYPDPTKTSLKIDDEVPVYDNGEKRMTKLGMVRAFKKYQRVEVELDDGTCAMFIDPRNFGNLSILDEEELNAKLSTIGPDLLVPDAVPVDWLSPLQAKIRAKKKIGEVLLDQSLFAGLGNIYRAETLYLAGISPHRSCGSLTSICASRLRSAAITVLRIAYETFGQMEYTLGEVGHILTDEYYQKLKAQAKVDSIPLNASFRGHFVYGQSHDPLGYPVISDVLGGRTMWWCPAVQA
jgi:formamidopyrimidine-DNA glycosylase